MVYQAAESTANQHRHRRASAAVAPGQGHGYKTARLPLEQQQFYRLQRGGNWCGERGFASGDTREQRGAVLGIGKLHEMRQE